MTLAAMVAFSATHATVAHADDSAAAQALFDQGKAALAAHNYGEACAKFEDSLRLEYGLGTLLNLARCYEAEGRTASAWSKYLEVASKARALGQMDRARIGHERAAALAPTLSNVVIDVPAAARVDGLVVQRDGTASLPTEWGSAIPTDPGKHTISASAPGRKPWSMSVVVPREVTTTHVAVPELDPVPVEPVSNLPPQPSKAAVSAVPALAISNPPSPESRPQQSGLGVQKSLAIASAVVGLGGIGVGTYFGLDSLAKHNEAKNVCPQVQCPVGAPQGVGLWRDAVNAGNISTIAFIAGGVGIAGGITLWLTAPGPERSNAASAQIELAPRMIRIHGTW